MDKIVNSVMSIILMAGLFGPYVIKIAHALNEHKDVHCTSKEVHVHSVEFDCDFDHYQLSSSYYSKFDYPKFFAIIPISVAINNHYYFLNKYQQFHFVLRGPPTC